MQTDAGATEQDQLTERQKLLLDRFDTQCERMLRFVTAHRHTHTHTRACACFLLFVLG